MIAWNRWYHVDGNTYGTWLHGDHRGWRTRHHRTHVPYDYKNPPPPEVYERLEKHSLASMKDAIVFLTPPQRKVACGEMAGKLLSLGVELLAISVDRIHYHMLARFPTDHVKHWVGLAKKHSAFMMRAHGIAGGVWAIGCRAGPIGDRTHQVHTFEYIRRHERKGAVVWTFRDSFPLTEDPVLEERLAELRTRKSQGG